MNRNNKHNIVAKLTGLLLILAMLTPSVIKLDHALNDHHHELCTSDVDEHFHQQEMDCEFQKFNLGSQFVLNIQSIESFIQKGFHSSDTTLQQSPVKSRSGLPLWRGPPVG